MAHHADAMLADHHHNVGISAEKNSKGALQQSQTGAISPLNK
jgi:hypothetical protein